MVVVNNVAALAYDCFRKEHSAENIVLDVTGTSSVWDVGFIFQMAIPPFRKRKHMSDVGGSLTLLNDPALFSTRGPTAMTMSGCTLTAASLRSPRATWKNVVGDSLLSLQVLLVIVVGQPTSTTQNIVLHKRWLGGPITLLRYGQSYMH